ncbi:peptide transporter ptr2, partial [Microsporum canis]
MCSLDADSLDAILAEKIWYGVRIHALPKHHADNCQKVKLSPQGNALPQAAKVIACAIRGRFRLDAAKPAFQASTYGREVEWNDQFVSEMKKGLIACKV